MNEHELSEEPLIGFGKVAGDRFSVYSLPKGDHIGRVRIVKQPILGSKVDTDIVSFEFDSLLKDNVGDHHKRVLTAPHPEAVAAGVKRCKAVITKSAVVVAKAPEFREFDSSWSYSKSQMPNIVVTPYDHGALTRAWRMFQMETDLENGVVEPDPARDVESDISRDLPIGHDFGDVAQFAWANELLDDDGLTMLCLDGRPSPVNSKERAGVGR